jgi:hypothetical protein
MKSIVPVRVQSCALSAALALIACGPTPGPAAPTAVVTSGPAPSAAAASSSTPSSAAESPSEPDAVPSAKITEVAGEPGKTAHMKVTAVFTNPGSRPCRIARYTLEWPGGTKEIQLDDFVIPAKETRQRSVKVHPDNGDLTKLSLDSARMALPAKCDAP